MRPNLTQANPSPSSNDSLNKKPKTRNRLGYIHACLNHRTPRLSLAYAFSREHRAIHRRYTKIGNGPHALALPKRWHRRSRFQSLACLRPIRKRKTGSAQRGAGVFGYPLGRHDVHRCDWGQRHCLGLCRTYLLLEDAPTRHRGWHERIL